jgi:hypothetical protein
VIIPEFRPDSECVWTYERLYQKTEPYCFRSDEFEDEATGMIISAGWWLSELALEDIENLECRN